MWLLGLANALGPNGYTLGPSCVLSGGFGNGRDAGVDYTAESVNYSWRQRARGARGRRRPTYGAGIVTADHAASSTIASPELVVTCALTLSPEKLIATSVAASDVVRT